MKKLAAAVLMASSAFIAVPAAAQVTGTVNVTGTVAARCSVTGPDQPAESTFTGTIDLSRLDDDDGTIRDDLTGVFFDSPADDQHVFTQVVCNTAAPVVSISATAMQVSGGTLDGTTGYADTIHYTAQVEVDTVGGTSEFRRYNTLTGAAPLAPAGSIATGSLTNPIAVEGSDNIDVTVYGLATEVTNINILTAGTYLGVITITINPT